MTNTIMPGGGGRSGGNSRLGQVRPFTRSTSAAASWTSPRQIRVLGVRGLSDRKRPDRRAGQARPRSATAPMRDPGRAIATTCNSTRGWAPAARTVRGCRWGRPATLRLDGLTGAAPGSEAAREARRRPRSSPPRRSKCPPGRDRSPRPAPGPPRRRRRGRRPWPPRPRPARAPPRPPASAYGRRAAHPGQAFRDQRRDGRSRSSMARGSRQGRGGIGHLRLHDAGRSFCHK